MKFSRILLLLSLVAIAACDETIETPPTTTTLRVVNECIENELAAAYLNNVSYDTTYSTTSINNYCLSSTSTPYEPWQPLPVVVEAQDSTYLFWNLIPGKVFETQINGEKLTVTPTGRVRMIYLPSSSNIRDMGGWKSTIFKHEDGSPCTICYGRIYRGAAIDGSFSLTESDISTMLNDLRITADIDLRTDDESHNRTSSPLGEEVDYLRIPSSSGPAVLDNKILAREFLWILDKLRKEGNIYIHCAHGADRTGVMAFMFEALLGVSESDMSKDYELTSFFTYRPRTREDFSGFVSALKKLEGSTLCEKSETYFYKYGITETDLEDFRRIMLE